MQFSIMLKGLAFLATFAMVLAASLPVTEDSVTGSASNPKFLSRAELAARQFQSPEDFGTTGNALCLPIGGHPDWKPAPYNPAMEAVHELFAQDGAIQGIGPGWGTCEVISCINGGEATVWWCNDNAENWYIDVGWLGAMADQIANDCFQDLSIENGYTGGQLFDSLDFNVILKSDNCQNVGKRVPYEEIMGPRESREPDLPSAQPATREFQPLVARQDIEVGIGCFKDGYRQDWPPAVTEDVEAAIRQIRGGTFPIGPGWGTCEEVTCYETASIVLCNDNPTDLILPLSLIGHWASTINNKCYTQPPYDPNGREETAGGQLFTSGDYNVIVRKADSCPNGKSKREVEVIADVPSVQSVARDVQLLVTRQGNEVGIGCSRDGYRPDWLPAAVEDIETAANQIDNTAMTTRDAGHGVCGEVTCYNTASIVLCNDSGPDNALTITNSIIADWARTILNSCYFHPPGDPNARDDTAGGQVFVSVFSSYDYNVIVRQTTSCSVRKREVEESIASFETRDTVVPVPIARDIATPELASPVTARYPVDYRCASAYGWETVPFWDTIDGIQWLGNSGQTVNVPPMECLMVWCQNSAGIFICNPSGEGINVQGIDIASLAELIANDCTVGTGGDAETGGVAWDSDGWYVVVRWNAC